MFAADAATFLADLGESVVWASSPATPKPTGLMILDLPDTDLESGQIISAEYEVTFETAAWPGLKRGEMLTVGGSGGGASYKLRTDPYRQDDGVFSRVKLSKP